MTTGTVSTFDARRGTGTLRASTGATFPFSSKSALLAVGEAVSFSLVGGLAGVYALNVQPVAARTRASRSRSLGSALTVSWPTPRALAMG